MPRAVEGGPAQPVHITGSDAGLPVTLSGGGTAGTPAGGVQSVQGVSGGTPVPVTQTGALPAGTNNIGDVDIATFPTGTRTFGTITVTASAVQCASVVGRKVTFKARDGNVAAISIGGSGVTTSSGWELLPGALSPPFFPANLNEFYIIGANTSDMVDYVIETV